MIEDRICYNQRAPVGKNVTKKSEGRRKLLISFFASCEVIITRLPPKRTQQLARTRGKIPEMYRSTNQRIGKAPPPACSQTFLFLFMRSLLCISTVLYNCCTMAKGGAQLLVPSKTSLSFSSSFFREDIFEAAVHANVEGGGEKKLKKKERTGERAKNG